MRSTVGVQQVCNTGIGNIEPNEAELLEMKHTIQQIKNSLESLNNRMGKAEERISV